MSKIRKDDLFSDNAYLINRKDFIKALRRLFNKKELASLCYLYITLESARKAAKNGPKFPEIIPIINMRDFDPLSCSDWKHCMNPNRDCINCSLRNPRSNLFQVT